MFLALLVALDSCMIKRDNITLKNTPEGRIMVVQARKTFKRGGRYHRLDCNF